MASGRRKARVLQKDLPPLAKIGENFYGYLVRHRVIAEDRNRFSPWSPVQAIGVFDSLNTPQTVSGTMSVQGDSIQVVWGDAEDRPEYDIFVSFDEGPFQYHGTSPIHSYSFLKEGEPSLVSVTIQVASIPKERSDVLTILDINATIGA